LDFAVFKFSRLYHTDKGNNHNTQHAFDIIKKAYDKLNNEMSLEAAASEPAESSDNETIVLDSGDEEANNEEDRYNEGEGGENSEEEAEENVTTGKRQFKRQEESETTKKSRISDEDEYESDESTREDVRFNLEGIIYNCNGFSVGFNLEG
jgi:hypothetical protein